MVLPILYKKNNQGKLQQWQVMVEGCDVVTLYGQLGGAIQKTTDTIKSGKNLGKVNATTPEQQAEVKAQQMFDKKIKEGYVDSSERALSGDSEVEGISPMLAFPIEKKSKYATFPAILEPKLDGLRCIAMIDNGKVRLFSRTGKPFTTVPHIITELEYIFAGATLILDGELYNHEYKDDFNKIISLIKRDELHPDHTKIEYHVYDVVGNSPYLERTISAFLSIKDAEYLKPIEYVLANSEDEMYEYFQDCLARGYEGCMYRNMEAPYENKRSPYLLKVKEMQDAEFEIIGVEEGNGKLQGKAGAIVCKTESGEVFKAKMKGGLDTLSEYLVNIDRYIGKKLTVQFQNLTPSGVPRFPVGLRVRQEE